MYVMYIYLIVMGGILCIINIKHTIFLISCYFKKTKIILLLATTIIFNKFFKKINIFFKNLLNTHHYLLLYLSIKSEKNMFYINIYKHEHVSISQLFNFYYYLAVLFRIT